MADLALPPLSPRVLRQVGVLLFSLWVWAPAVTGQEAEDTSPYSDAELVTDRLSVRPGETFDVALRVTMDPGWHNYWINPGDAGMPTRIAWELPGGRRPRARSAGRTRSGSRSPRTRATPTRTRSSSSPDHRPRGVRRLHPRPPRRGLVADLRGRVPPGERVRRPLAPRRGRPPPAGPALGCRGAGGGPRRPADPPPRGLVVPRPSAPKDGYVLRRGAPGLAGRESLEGVRFFPYQKGVIRHPAAQPVAPGEEGFTFTLARSEFARGDARPPGGRPRRPRGRHVGRRGAGVRGGRAPRGGQC
jgi:hypothetical protein